jgi:hypothetical protein
MAEKLQGLIVWTGAPVWDAGSDVEERPFEGRVERPREMWASAPVVVVRPGSSQIRNSKP